MLIGALEAGGTKFKCAVAISSGEIMKSVVIKTTTIEETMQKVVNFFLPYHIEDLGVGCFGPISLDKKSKFYGQILDTPKEKWKYYDIYNYLKDKLNCNVYINTDVVTSAYGEYYFGFNSLYKNILYFTVGTGIGVGVIYNGNVLQGNHHTEMGHITINREKNDDYLSTCEFHDNCLEGLASGNSLDNRYNLTYEQLENREDILRQEAFYLAQGIYAY
ncbi:MAG: ROK family protein, partial [Bacilli bacterium]